MKIEGLGQRDTWYGEGVGQLKQEDLKPGLSIGRSQATLGDMPGEVSGDEWIITDVLGDGKFKAVPKSTLERYTGDATRRDIKPGELKLDLSPENLKEAAKYSESFDISGKVDTSNPIYRFYEKEVGRYLKNQYGAELNTDAQGVTWWQLNVPKGAGRAPVEAFGAGAIPIVAGQEQKK